MSYVRIYIHAVFCTKNRYAFLNKEIRKDLFRHIKENSDEKKIWLDSINGYEDHVHCLIALRREQSISEVIQLIKGESSYWINKIGLTKNKFYWQDDYWAVGVGEERLQQIRQYIFNQEEHHKTISLDKEIEKFFPMEESFKG
jgi:putative transposase